MILFAVWIAAMFGVGIYAAFDLEFGWFVVLLHRLQLRNGVWLEDYSNNHKDAWHWVRIKFDALKNVRSVPTYSPLGFHLSREPIDRETLKHNGLRGGMENL